MDRQELRDFKKYVDISFKDFSRTYGDGIETFFDPLLYFLVWFEKLLINAPWPLIIFVIAIMAWVGSRSWIVVSGTVCSFILIGVFWYVGRYHVNTGYYFNLHFALYLNRDTNWNIYVTLRSFASP